MRSFRYILIILSCISLLKTSKAQYVGAEIIWQDQQRLQQLLDTSDQDKTSYFIRHASADVLRKFNRTNYPKPTLQLSLVNYTLHKNDKLTLSDNDGSMIPALGMQQRITLGARMQYKNWFLQLQPEYITAENTQPETFSGDPNNGNYWSRYYLYTINKVDALTRFGKTQYQRWLPGQSRLSYQYKQISAGISTENLWWGPGIRNSLVLTNQAPGFLHFTVNSTKPILTKWGNIEFQAIWGWLNKTPFLSEEDSIMRNIWAGGILGKPDTVNRGILGYQFVFNPKWTPNLYIGFSGVSYFFTQEVEAKASPDLLLPHEVKAGPARLGAISLRYVMPKERAELYMEYGRANRWAAPWNIFGDTIPTGYMAGFRKLIPLKLGKKASYLLLHAEITQLQLPDARLVFNPQNPLSIPKTNSWYTHAYVTQGYTNEGQVIGAGIGPGSNSQSLFLSWIQGKKRIGLQVERVANNNDFAIYSNFTGLIGSGTADRYWVNMQYGINAQWDIGPWLISGFYQYTHALNYRWVKLHSIFSEPSEADRVNKRFSITLTRFFN